MHPHWSQEFCVKRIFLICFYFPPLSLFLCLRIHSSIFRLQFGYSFFHCKSVLSGVYLHTIPQQYFCLLKLSGLVSGTCFRLEPSKPNIPDLKYWNKYTTLTTISNNPFLRVWLQCLHQMEPAGLENKRQCFSILLYTTCLGDEEELCVHTHLIYEKDRGRNINSASLSDLEIAFGRWLNRFFYLILIVSNCLYKSHLFLQEWIFHLVLC